MCIPAMPGHWFVTSMYWAATPALTQEHHKDHSAADVNWQFHGPESRCSRVCSAVRDGFAGIFAQRQAIVQAVDLRPGLAVADIGEGTGLFTCLRVHEVFTREQEPAPRIPASSPRAAWTILIGPSGEASRAG